MGNEALNMEADRARDKLKYGVHDGTKELIKYSCHHFHIAMFTWASSINLS
jgi:hypothetical protein